MRTAVIGSGDIGGALAVRFAERHEVIACGSRPGSASVAQAIAESGGRIREGAPATAVRDADVVVLAVPWDALDATLDRALPLDGRILVVVTLPYVEGSDVLVVGTTTSGAERIAARVGGARVVQAFNTVAAPTVRAPNAHGLAATAIVSSDDAAAKDVVLGLAREIGLDAVDGGPLRTARYTEAMAMLYARLAFDVGLGEDVAFRVLRGPSGP